MINGPATPWEWDCVALIAVIAFAAAVIYVGWLFYTEVIDWRK